MIVDFLEGDPDRPIIVGSVFNPDQMPPYLGDGPDSHHKNDPKISGIKSNSTPAARVTTSYDSTTPRARSRSSSTPRATTICASTPVR